MIEIFDAQELTQQLQKNPNAVVLFYASWCPFCRNFLPVFEEYAKTSSPAVYMRVKLDEDENPLWERYSLDAVPSVLLFENGEVKRRLDCQRGIGLTKQLFSNWLQTA
ncbi:MAG: thioredoxin family protein [Candidatus Bathyarchaeota archaeon]|nr:thioredoxin family protein [Candidatus Bathyarchaeota archaeon]